MRRLLGLEQLVGRGILLLLVVLATLGAIEGKINMSAEKKRLFTPAVAATWKFVQETPYASHSNSLEKNISLTLGYTQFIRFVIYKSRTSPVLL